MLFVSAETVYQGRLTNPPPSVDRAGLRGSSGPYLLEQSELIIPSDEHVFEVEAWVLEILVNNIVYDFIW